MSFNQKKKKKLSSEEREKRWNLGTRKRRKMISNVLFTFFTLLAIVIVCFVVYIYSVG